MIITFFIWLLKSALILAIFHFVLPVLVNSHSQNSWIKLPMMLVLGIVAGIFMAWLQYVPYLLFFLWLALNKSTLAVMLEPNFEAEANMRIRKSVFYVSSYMYIVVACASDWFFQMKTVQGADPSGQGIPLWKHLIGG